MREFPSPQEILKIFERDPRKTFRLRELVVELGLRSSQARELKSALKDLSRRGRIVYLKKNHFALAHKDRHAATENPVPAPPGGASPARARGTNVVSGRLIGHRDGYGFVVPDAPLAGTDLDIYISSDGMGSAMHGDRVEVQVLRAKPDGRCGRPHPARQRARAEDGGGPVSLRRALQLRSRPLIIASRSRSSFRAGRSGRAVRCLTARVRQE